MRGRNSWKTPSSVKSVSRPIRSSGHDLEAVQRDAQLPQRLQAGPGEILPHHAHHQDRRVAGGGGGEVESAAAQDLLDAAMGRLDAVQGGGANDQYLLRHVISRPD
jgi:hypothetical protein